MTIADNLSDLQRDVAAARVPRPDVVIADPTGLCSQCPVGCLGDLHSCPLLSHREVIAALPPVLLHLRKGDMALACRAMGAGIRGLQLHRRGLMGLRDAVLAVVSGSVWNDPDLSSDLLELLRKGSATAAANVGGEAEPLLSGREREVLSALESGATVAAMTAEERNKRLRHGTEVPRAWIPEFITHTPSCHKGDGMGSEIDHLAAELSR